MKHAFPTLLAAALSVGSLVAGPTAASIGTPITISDQNVFGVGWYGDHEDNETEARPFTVKDQTWDLEGMYLKDWTLTLVGGFDFKNGATLGSAPVKGGDIFIAVNHAPVYGSPANDGSGTGGTTLNTFGYDYVIHFNSDLTKYSVFGINDTATVNRVTDVASSNPASYNSGGTLLLADIPLNYGLLTPAVAGALSTYPYTAVGLQGYSGNNDHYYLNVQTSFLPTSSVATYHYTMECGNDVLMGRAATPPTVPDGGSAALMMLGGLVMLWLGRGCFRPLPRT